MDFLSLRAGYKLLWDKCVVTKIGETTAEAKRIVAAKAEYEGYKVPWFVVGIIHCREAGSPPDFKAVLHNGERIVGTNHKTHLVPKNRGPFATWREATIDALRIDHLDTIVWDDGWGPEHVAYALEAFNGFGYRKHGIPSPYLWGGTNVQERGKFTADKHYDAGVMDPQIGGMALLRELMALDNSVTFGTAQDTVPTPSNEPISTPPAEPAQTEDQVSSDEPPEADKPYKPPVENDPKKIVEKHHLWGMVGAISASVGTYFHQHYVWVLVGLGVCLTAILLYKALKHKNTEPPEEVPIPQLSPKATE